MFSIKNAQLSTLLVNNDLWNKIPLDPNILLLPHLSWTKRSIKYIKDNSGQHKKSFQYLQHRKRREYVSIAFLVRSPSSRQRSACFAFAYPCTTVFMATVLLFKITIFIFAGAYNITPLLFDGLGRVYFAVCLLFSRSIYNLDLYPINRDWDRGLHY